MRKIWQFSHCLKFLFAIFVFSGCEQKPLVLDLGDNGLNLDVTTLSNFYTQTEQKDTLQIGDSFKLYVGAIDEQRKSQILLEINSQLLIESNVCNDSTDVINAYIELRSTDKIYSPIGESDDEIANPSLGRTLNVDSTQFSAFYIPNLDSLYNWDGNNIHFDESLETDLSENISLNLSINEYYIKIHLDTLLQIHELCDSTNTFHILLKDDNPNRLTEFFSTEFYGSSVVPQFNVEIEYLHQDQIEVEKYNILSIDSEFMNEEDFNYELNDENEITGIIKSQNPNSILDAPYVVTWEDTAMDIEFFNIHVELEDIDEDSLNSVNFFLHGLNFSNHNMITSENSEDPAGDNWNAEDSIGTEGNGIYNFGEYFEDCGIDSLCDEDEEGYNPNGTENNESYDFGEFYLDCGLDSLCDEDEEGYDILLNPDPAGDNYKIDPANDNWLNDVLIDSYFVYNEIEVIDSVDCQLDFQGFEFHTWLTDMDSNLDLLDSWCEVTPNINCSSCDTLVQYFSVDSTMVYERTGTEKNDNWDFEDLNQNGNLDEGELHETFIDLGFDNFPESEGNELNDPEEGNGQWDFEDLNENGLYDLGEPHENFTDCGIDNLCDEDEEGYNPGGKENNLQYDYGEFFEDCGVDQFCGETPDIDDLVLDPHGDNWSSIDSLGTEANNIYDSLEVYRDWGIDQLPDSLEMPISTIGGDLNFYVGTNTWEIQKYAEIDTIFTRPDLGENDGVVWISSITGGQNNYEVTISIYSMERISLFELGINHIPFFDYIEELVEETVFHTNFSIEAQDNISFINDISAYPKSLIEIDSNNFHINYSDNFNTKIEVPQLDSIISANMNKTVSAAKFHFKIDTTSSNYFVNEAGVKVIFNKFLAENLDSFDENKSTITTKIVREETSIEIDFTTEMQKLLTGESKNFGYILEASRESNNLSHLTFFNELDSLNHPYLEIMFIK